MVTIMKPLEHIRQLIDATSIPANIQHGKNRQIIALSQYITPVCVVIHEGTANAYRDADHLLISKVVAPLIVGINMYSAENLRIYIQAIGPINFEIIEIERMMKIIQEKNLWESLAYYTNFLNQVLVKNYFSTIGVSSYEMICFNLKELMKQDTEFRNSITASDYIQEKTQLSRSAIMKTLSDLKKGGYIEIEQGILLNVHKLPRAY